MLGSNIHPSSLDCTVDFANLPHSMNNNNNNNNNNYHPQSLEDNMRLTPNQYMGGGSWGAGGGGKAGHGFATSSPFHANRSYHHQHHPHNPNSHNNNNNNNHNTNSRGGAAGAANKKGRHMTYNAYGELCMTVVDPATRKLLIPLPYTQETRAQQRSTLPSLCQLYLQGRCRQGANCYQVHAQWEAVAALRSQIDYLPCCCVVHGDHDEVGTQLDAEAYGARAGCAPVARSLREVCLYVPHCERDEDGYLALDRVSYTVALQRLLAEQDPLRDGAAALRRHAGRVVVDATGCVVCRLHAMDRCRYAEECKFLHLCKEVTRANPRLTEETAPGAGGDRDGGNSDHVHHHNNQNNNNHNNGGGAADGGSSNNGTTPDLELQAGGSYSSGDSTNAPCKMQRHLQILSPDASLTSPVATQLASDDKNSNANHHQNHPTNNKFKPAKPSVFIANSLGTPCGAHSVPSPLTGHQQLLVPQRDDDAEVLPQSESFNESCTSFYQHHPYYSYSHHQPYGSAAHHNSVGGASLSPGCPPPHYAHHQRPPQQQGVPCSPPMSYSYTGLPLCGERPASESASSDHRAPHHPDARDSDSHSASSCAPAAPRPRSGCRSPTLSAGSTTGSSHNITGTTAHSGDERSTNSSCLPQPPQLQQGYAAALRQRVRRPQQSRYSHNPYAFSPVLDTADAHQDDAF